MFILLGCASKFVLCEVNSCKNSRLFYDGLYALDCFRVYLAAVHNRISTFCAVQNLGQGTRSVPLVTGSNVISERKFIECLTQFGSITINR